MKRLCIAPGVYRVGSLNCHGSVYDLSTGQRRSGIDRHSGVGNVSSTVIFIIGIIEEHVAGAVFNRGGLGRDLGGGGARNSDSWSGGG